MDVEKLLRFKLTVGPGKLAIRHKIVTKLVKFWTGLHFRVFVCISLYLSDWITLHSEIELTDTIENPLVSSFHAFLVFTK